MFTNLKFNKNTLLFSFTNACFLQKIGIASRQLKSTLMANVFETIALQNLIASFRYKFNLNFFLFEAIITKLLVFSFSTNC